MKKKYYSLIELDNLPEKIDIKKLAIYTQENLIHPFIYIDSLPAHACEVESSKDRNIHYVLGHCHLTGYLDVKEIIVGFLNILARGEHVDIQSFLYKSLFIEEPQISSWQISDQSLKSVPPNQRRLKPCKEQANIECFFLLRKLTIDNIRLSYEDFERLNKYLIEREVCLNDEEKFKALVMKKKQRSNLAKINGKKGSASRKTEAEAKWKEIQPKLLELAIKYKGYTANKIADIAVKRGIITKEQQSNISKKIRNDNSLHEYLRRKK